MKKSFLFLLIILLLSTAVMAITKEDYLEMVSNTQNCMANCETVYKLKVPVDLTKEAATLDITFYDLKSKQSPMVNNVKFQYYSKGWIDSSLSEISNLMDVAKTSDALLIKVSGSIGWGQIVDNIPSFAGYSYPEYAVWDGRNLYEDFSTTTGINLSLSNDVIINTIDKYLYINNSAEWIDYNSGNYQGALDNGLFVINGSTVAVISNVSAGTKGG